MEWIRISPHKLKIMLSAEDARRYALNCEKADYADIMTRDAFREILTDVQKETGFETEKDKVYIQMYPSKEGGCELFVTRMGLAFSEDEPSPPIPSYHTPKKEIPPKTVRKTTVSFLFSGLEQLLSLCRRVANIYHGDSEIWQDEKKRWWLLLNCDGNQKSTREILCIAREYGAEGRAEDASLFLPEHGHLICANNAIDVLSKL